jgi:hypothetical protein
LWKTGGVLGVEIPNFQILPPAENLPRLRSHEHRPGLALKSSPFVSATWVFPTVGSPTPISEPMLAPAVSRAMVVKLFSKLGWPNLTIGRHRRFGGTP